MKKSILALSLLFCLLLSGCGEVLAGSYQTSSPHVDRPATAEDSSAIRVESYRELVSAVLYLVSQGEEKGELRFYDYPGDVEAALTEACLEVATQDPLGAYCVDYIRHETTRVVSYDQATVSIHYRRTMEQVRSIVRVTGTSAIRTELREALGAFQKEVVLRVTYFDQDIDSITQLIQQAYYDNPAAALGFPQVEVALYPDSGSQRVVEILLTYPEPVDTLTQKAQTLSQRAQNLSRVVQGMGGVQAAEALAEALWLVAEYDPQAADTPYAALIEGMADDQGMALAYLLLCKEAGLTGEFVQGTVNGGLHEGVPENETAAEASEAPEETPPEFQPRCWVALDLTGDSEALVYLDLSQKGSRLASAQEMFDAGYRWPGGPEEPEATPEVQSGDFLISTDGENS